MSEEVSGDISLNFDLILSFNQVQQSSLNKIESMILIIETVNSALTNEILSPLSDIFDQLVESSFLECYGGFVSITDSVVESDIVTILIGKVKEAIPVQWLKL